MNDEVFVKLDDVINLVFPLLNEIDINLLEDIQYIDLAEEWVRIIESEEYQEKVLDLNFVDLDEYIKFKLRKFFISNCDRKKGERKDESNENK